MKNVNILGVNHVSKKSIENIDKALEKDVDAVCLELDRDRLKSLLKGDRSLPKPTLIKTLGVSGYLFSLVATVIQRAIGKYTGVLPGDEMLHGFNEAKKTNTPIALIDRPIPQTLQKFKHIPIREKLRLVTDSLNPFRKVSLPFTLESIPSPSELKPVIDIFSDRYPYTTDVLLHSRDEYMATMIQKVLQRHDNILVIVGAAHIPGIQKRLNTTNNEKE